ncbi:MULTISPECIES: helix-turn-helix domain-containing protein [unclassified Pseudomonas]|uniref:helix-turn-helix domain-containing protein n=1 Tax=unclassified Pseudomonas TaxID=196821 RepID=UPI001EE33654|nr:helix-turn-helix transcriptional regulator [Pseudomonas sp. RW3S2]
MESHEIATTPKARPAGKISRKTQKNPTTGIIVPVPSPAQRVEYSLLGDCGMDYNEAFGSVFRSLRLMRGLTQEAFQPSATERYIRNIEKAKQTPTIEMVRDLCDVLRVSPMTLLAIVEAKHTGQNSEALMKAATLELRSLKKTSGI